MKKWAALAFSLALCFSVAFLGGWLTRDSLAAWYPTLAKPSWNPPDSVFAPVWTVLYATMGVSAWLVWCSGGGRSRVVALILFCVQLALNAAWSAIFFGLRNPGGAFAEIIVLWSTIIATLIAFFRVRPAAAGLLFPYFAWVSFAAALNFAVWRLNL